MAPREIHIAPGLSAAGSLRQALSLSPDSILASEDFLSCGPLVEFRSLNEWRVLRETYWGNVYDAEFLFSDSKRDLLTNTAALRDAESLMLWIGKGLAEQLFLSWIVQLLRLLSVDLQRLRVIQFERYADRDLEIWGLGILDPTQLVAHPQARQLTTNDLKEIEETWCAVTAARPTDLLALLSKTAQSLPHLRSSLRSMLERFPSRHAGLNSWEMKLLKNTKDRGPRAVRVIAYTLSENYGSDLIGDAWLFDRLRQLARPSLPHPLINLTGNPESLRECEVSLTDAGHTVLAGRGNCVTLNGIDDWIGGVHLDSASGNVWFHDGDSLVRGSK